jgi:CDP-diacylglycerol--glycerol-3-phosphate 3-phosphatidyltransferase
MIKKVPNIICWIRMLLVPVILVFILENPLSASLSVKTRFLIGGIAFGVAIISDLIDGKIARKYDAVTNFGKFLDPIADKFLVLSVLIAFVQLNILSAVPVLIILCRELTVTGLRLGAAGKGVVVAANYWGKIKTTVQGISIGVMFVFVALFPENLFSVTSEICGEPVCHLLIPQILLWLTAVYSAISAIPYYNAMKQYIKD